MRWPRPSATRTRPSSWCSMPISRRGGIFSGARLGCCCVNPTRRSCKRRSSITMPIRSSTICLPHKAWSTTSASFSMFSSRQRTPWGCAFCVGTSFIVRRDPLNEIGGFPSEAISEDINLTYTMLARGYRTVWLNEPLSFGLSAEGIPEYITQRARWCLGTIQVALLRNGPFFGRGFSFTQRWHYFHGVLNWLCKPFMVLLLIAPTIYWFAGLPAFEADYLSFLRYGMPALLAQVIYMGWISRARTLPLFIEATHTVTCFAVTATLLSALVKPFGRPFKITDKGGDRSAP